MELNEQNSKKTVFSGVQPSGVLHLGNYLGAIAQWVEMQNQYNSIFCVVDYHAITVKQEPKELSRRILDVVKIYLASGINPEKAVIFQQSDITAHTELAWILNCVAKVGELKRMTQLKDKLGLLTLDERKNIYKKYVDDEMEKIRQGKSLTPDIVSLLKRCYEDGKSKDKEHRESMVDIIIKGFDIYREVEEKFEKIISSEDKKFNNSNMGLFDYPVLMAADILLYNTDLVPVGEDQVQHVELTRTLAERFNRDYGPVFKVPAVAVRKQGARIMGLDDPAKKMSKSASSPANFVALTDAPEVAEKKIKRAVTDSGSEIKFDQKKKPALSNLMTIYSLLTGVGVKELEASYKGKGPAFAEASAGKYGEFKNDLAEEVKKFLREFQIKYHSFSDDEVRQILKDGADKVRPVAEATLKRVKNKLGIN